MDSLFDYRLDTLAAVAQTGSFTSAAQQMLISQPAVSQQIKSLEQNLGLELVVRDRRKAELTPAGRELANYVLSLSVEGNRLLSRLRDDQPGPLRIGATPSNNQFLIPKLLSHLMQIDCPFTTQVCSVDELLPCIDKGSIDLAFVDGNFDIRPYDYIDLASATFCAVLGPEDDAPTNWDEAFSLPLFVDEPGSNTRVTLENWLISKNYSISAFQEVVEIGDQTTIINLLKHGQGIAFMYRQLVEEELLRGELHVAPAEDFQLDIPLKAVFLKDSVNADEYRKLVSPLLTHTSDSVNTSHCDGLTHKISLKASV